MTMTMTKTTAQSTKPYLEGRHVVEARAVTSRVWSGRTSRSDVRGASSVR